jgi:hypothetical protein
MERLFPSLQMPFSNAFLSRFEGLDAIPRRDELALIAEEFSPRPTNKKKLANEQRVLYTYDAIACPSNRVTP